MSEDKTIWVVLLSDGRYITESEMSWIKLRHLILSDDSLKICKMWLKFRSHVIELPENANGYYFAKAISRESSSIDSKDMCVAGVLRDSEIDCVIFTVPELEAFKSEKRPVPNDGDERLIKNHG